MHTDSSDGSITGDLETERLERLTDIGFDEDWMDEDGTMVSQQDAERLRTEAEFDQRAREAEVILSDEEIEALERESQPAPPPAPPEPAPEPVAAQAETDGRIRYVRWHLTLFHFTKTQLRTWSREHRGLWRYMVAAEERCPQTQRKHIHVAIIFNTRQSLRDIKQWFGADVHAEMMEASFKSSLIMQVLRLVLLFTGNRDND